ncbi:MAG: lysylphosphatidylglycerol synthase domain-containing protein [Pseudomonadota bacterium]|nr:lysylphosphatidylglycerol synthase domain-containing protein [Pseudomonadota bacterium]
MTGRPLSPPAPAGRQPSAAARFRQSAWWLWLKRAGAGVFFIGVGYLLLKQARAIDWHQVLSALQNYPLAALWSAAGLAAASYALYSCFDLLGRHYTGHTLGTRTVMLLTFVSYAFNLNLGSVVGGVAFRYRLYSRLGLGLGTITRVTSVSMLANWMGYLLLAGLVFSVQPLVLPGGWKIDAAQLRLIGLGLLALALAYLGACAFSRQRTLGLRGHAVELPSLRLAGLQMAMGAGNWLLMSGIIFILLQQRIDFFSVVSVLLLAAIAGVITHIPGNLGVLEAIFMALLGKRIPVHDVLAALVAYRIVYYLVPLGLAALIYLFMEARTRQSAHPGAPRRPPPP